MQFLHRNLAYIIFIYYLILLYKIYRNNFSRYFIPIKIIGLNAGLGTNFLSISNYNDINGANFEDSTDPNYYPKSEFYDLFSDNKRVDVRVVVPDTGDWKRTLSNEDNIEYDSVYN